MFDFDLQTIIANIPALIIGFAFHEFAHAWVADRLGDPTPRSQGRLTLNPISHLDLFGTLMALLYRFGWAKPVMTNPRYYKGDKKRGQMMVALAGPLMNLFMAFIIMFLWILTMHWIQESAWSDIISLVFRSTVFMNLGLGIFNLIPIPPLDGFGVLRGLLPQRFSPQLYLLQQYGSLILIILLFTDILSQVLVPVMYGIAFAYQKIILLILTPFLG